MLKEEIEEFLKQDELLRLSRDDLGEWCDDILDAKKLRQEIDLCCCTSNAPARRSPVRGQVYNRPASVP